MSSEYYELVEVLNEKLAIKQFKNQFFNYLVQIIQNKDASRTEVLWAYLGALSTLNELGKSLPFKYQGNLEDIHPFLSDFNLELSSLNDQISLLESLSQGIHPYIEEGFKLKELRNIEEFEADISLRKKLNINDFSHYRSAGQRDAIRLCLTSERNNTIIANLPTGVGKTLIAHSLIAFEQPQNLTVLIVPTVALAIEQAKRVSDLFDKMAISHSGDYAWYGTLSEKTKAQIKDRLKQGTQKVIVASPEAICRSLLPVLIEAASSNKLANFIIDEAHIVDSWGAGFRPEFQLLSAVLGHLRNLSKDGVKCLLMSATITESTLTLLKSFFEVANKEIIEINGSFIRPEISYEVQKCNSEKEYDDKLIQAVVNLPKPQIVYAVTQEKANNIFSLIKNRLDLNRIGLFTGDTGASERESLIKSWNDEKLDIMVATSAFGVGMNRLNIRAIIHGQIPENIDRYYQEVGRAGRDGKSALSLLLYQEEDEDIAKKINDEKIITLDVGYERWLTLWNHRKSNDDGIELDLQVFRRGLQRNSKANAEWNIHTLLLMQRTGLLKLNFKELTLPEWDDSIPEAEYQNTIREYFQNYYSSLLITDVDNQVFEARKWKEAIGKQRVSENKVRKEAFNNLLNLIETPTNNCFGKVFQNAYSISGKHPEYACSGCPCCFRLPNKKTIIIDRLGRKDHVLGWSKVSSWSGYLANLKKYQFVYFNKSSYRNVKKQTREWKTWLSYLLESKQIQRVICSEEVAELIYKSLPAGINLFWLNDPIKNDLTEESFWPQLVLLREELYIPEFGWDTLSIIIAPDDIHSTESTYRMWWETKQSAISFENFEASIKWQ